MDKPEGKQKHESKGGGNASPKKSKKQRKKELPDINKLGKSSPTKIPRNAKKPEEVGEYVERINWKVFGLGIVALAVLVLAAHAFSIGNGLVLADTANFQFMQHGQKDPNFSMQLWSDAIGHPSSQGWTLSTYGWDLTSFKWNPGWSHAVNISLHFFACLYFYFLIFRISWRLHNEGRLKANPYFVAIASAALLGVHPLTTGAIAYISGRAGSLVALNYFLGLNIFLMGYAAEGMLLASFLYLLSLLFMGIGLLCDPRAITMPLAVILLGLLLKSPQQKFSEWLPIRGYDLLIYVFAAIAVPFSLFTGDPMKAPLISGVKMPVLSFISYWATQFKEIATYYVRCTLVPIGLSIEPPLAIATSFADPFAILGVAIVVSVAVASWYFREKTLIAFGCVLFLLGLMPWIFLPNATHIADQRFYLSLAGVCLIAGSLLGELYETNKRKAIITSAALLVAFTGLSIWRSLDWKSESTVWKQAVDLNPDSARTRIFYAQALSSRGKHDEAIEQANKALGLSPDDEFALQILGRTKMAKKDYAGAIKNLQRAVEIGSKSRQSPREVAEFQRDLALSYLRLKQYDDALALANKANLVIPNDSNVHLVIGSVLLEKKNYKDAFLQLANGFTNDEDNVEFFKPMAEAAVNSRVPMWARYGLSAAERNFMLQNMDRDSSVLLAKAALAAGKPNVAVRALAKYSSEVHKDAEACYLMSVALLRQGSLNQAQMLRKRALEYDPKIESKTYVPDGPASGPAPVKTGPTGIRATPTTVSPAATPAAATPVPAPVTAAPVKAPETAPSAPASGTVSRTQPSTPKPAPKVEKWSAPVTTTTKSAAPEPVTTTAPKP